MARGLKARNIMQMILDSTTQGMQYSFETIDLVLELMNVSNA